MLTMLTTSRPVVAFGHEGHRHEERDEHHEQPEASLVEDARHCVARTRDRHAALP
jgi:hypothetical protein